MIRVTKFSRKEISEMPREISYVYENQQMTHSSVESQISSDYKFIPRKFTAF